VSDEHTRREALLTLAASAAATLVGAPKGAEATLAPAAGAPGFFTAEEIEVVRLLSERILPADESSPGARAAGVAERIDVVLQGASDAEKARWRDGIQTFERLCQERFARSLREAGEAEHDALLLASSGNEARPETPVERFFTSLKAQTVDAYYTSEIGVMKELQYKGNTYLADFPGCTHEKHRS
jgi:hypothetical protein